MEGLQARYKIWLKDVDRQARLKGISREAVIQAVRVLSNDDMSAFALGKNLFNLELDQYLKLYESKVILQVVADIIDRSTNGNEVHVWLNAPWNTLLGKEKVWLPASVVLE